MNYKLLLVGQKVPIILSAEQATFVKEKMNDPGEIITIGLSTFKAGQIRGIFPAEEIRQGKATVREELNRAAKNCGTCNGVGFVEGYFNGEERLSAWEGGCEVRMALCRCQEVIKGLNGIEAEDFDKLYTEFSLND